ncbi:MAG: sterol desaturase family protein [Pseudomonadota bacterium]
MALKVGFWSDKSHYLNRMTFRQLVVAYFQYYAIQAYLLLGVISTFVAINTSTSLALDMTAVAFSVLAYPLAWYSLHRWVLHSKYLFKSSLTAKVWKRIHYDHHQDPHHLEVLFGALYTTLPTIALITMPAGYLINGVSGAAAGLAGGLFTTCFYEFCHCIQHLAYKPKYKFLQEMKRKHMAHHFHDETGNFGITNFMWDKLLGTNYEATKERERSETVFNLGYTKDAAEKYPWVANMSGGVSEDPSRPRSHRERKKLSRNSSQEAA